MERKSDYPRSILDEQQKEVMRQRREDKFQEFQKEIMENRTRNFEDIADTKQLTNVLFDYYKQQLEKDREAYNIAKPQDEPPSPLEPTQPFLSELSQNEKNCQSPLSKDQPLKKNEMPVEISSSIISTVEQVIDLSEIQPITPIQQKRRRNSIRRATTLKTGEKRFTPVSSRHRASEIFAKDSEFRERNSKLGQYRDAIDKKVAGMKNKKGKKRT